MNGNPNGVREARYHRQGAFNSLYAEHRDEEGDGKPHENPEEPVPRHVAGTHTWSPLFPTCQHGVRRFPVRAQCSVAEVNPPEHVSSPPPGRLTAWHELEILEKADRCRAPGEIGARSTPPGGRHSLPYPPDRRTSNPRARSASPIRSRCALRPFPAGATRPRPAARRARRPRRRRPHRPARLAHRHLGRLPR